MALFLFFWGGGVMGINELISVLQKYKHAVIKRCLLTYCYEYFVYASLLIVQIILDKHTWEAWFLDVKSIPHFCNFSNINDKKHGRVSSHTYAIYFTYICYMCDPIRCSVDTKQSHVSFKANRSWLDLMLRHGHLLFLSMMTSSNKNIFRPPVNSRTKASDTELCCFLWSASELTVE